MKISTRLTGLLLLVLLVLLGVTVAGCGEKDETPPEKVRADKVILMLDWQPNANHAGIYRGMADGSFKKRALVVDPKVPSDPAGVIKTVAAGRADLGISYASYVLAAQDKGAGVKAIASIVNVPLNSLIWLKKSKIKSIKDLKGKTVAVSGDGPSDTLNTILEQNNVSPDSVKQVNVGYDIQKALVSGKADASITGYWNVEGVQLEQAGLDPTIIPVDKAGSPTYDELVVVASTQNLKDARRVEVYRRFIAGLEEGTANAVDDPAAAFAALADKYPDLKKTASDRKFNQASLKATLPVLAQTNIGENPFGWMDPATWAAYGKWLRDNGELTTSGTTYTDAITNELLPGVTPDDEGPTQGAG
ncbi:MAG: ABC transporter substrate-binding protein [Thermoleophilaceae bacterium]|nr:ABC transporter substrate-binding protein [Thermoleophilaceae bacterium]